MIKRERKGGFVVLDRGFDTKAVAVCSDIQYAPV